MSQNQNGISNVLNDEEQAYRNHVVLTELGAREAEALWKKYHFTIEAEKCRDEYNSVMQKAFERTMQQRKELDEFKKAAEQNNELMAKEVINELSAE